MKIKYVLAIFFLIALSVSSCKLNVEADKKENSDTVLPKPSFEEVPFSELVDYLKNTAVDTEVNYITVTGLTDANLASSWVDSNDTLGAILRQDITKKIALKLNGSFSQLGAQAFKSCKNLVSIKIPTHINKIDSATFLGCEGLTSINIPANVKIIGENAFFQCYGLTEINIAEGVEGIGQYAFDDCKKANIRLPKTIQVIGKAAFGEKTEGNIIVPGKDTRVLKVLVPTQTEAQAPATKTVKQMVIDTLPSPGFPVDRIEEYN